VEKTASGVERSQTLSFRGTFNQPTPFRFEPIEPQGNLRFTFHVFGTFTITPVLNAYSVRLETLGRPVPGAGLPRRIDSAVQLSPGEVVEVQLPRVAGVGLAAMIGSQYAIRIRARQVR